MASPRALIDFASPQEGLAPIRLAFDEPEEELVARAPAQVLQTLRLAEERARRGLWCVGYLRYEAASAFDPKLEVHTPDGPLAYFGVHRRPIAWPDMVRDIDHAVDWSRAVDRQEFDAALSRLHAAIEAGEVYQVNYTGQLNADYLGEPFDLFCALHRAQPKSNATFIATDDEQILSVSPELFFDWDGHAITCAPMKGTAPRGATPELDALNARALQECAKERAENVMIVDLIRNDVSRVAQLGSVQVSRLFDCQAWPTVWQMVSEVVAKTRPAMTLAEIFAALFPCGSITGAPKRRAMHWIKRLEPSPRGAYCGAVGMIQPGGAARFNVPIRTVTLRSGVARCGIGSGITWSSLTHREWSEWQHKASFLQQASHPFELLQTLRVHAGECLHLEMHLDRMEAAAGHFGFKFDREEVRRHVLDLASGASTQDGRLRVLVNCGGGVHVELHSPPQHRWPDRWCGWPLALSMRPSRSCDTRLHIANI
jgi:para-aminobenzoate synthetase/4-amino-4-deoxychorismate lyase